MNEPDEPTDSTDSESTEDSLRRLATDTDAGISTTTPPSPASSAAGESEAAGPTADDAAPSPEDTVPAAPPADPEPDNAATELARLRAELARQKTEVARLTRLTSLQGGSGPGTGPAAPKRFADLSEREMAAEITRMAADIDGF